LSAGNLSAALHSFARVIESQHTSRTTRLGALEGTARAHLAAGRLTDCEAALAAIEEDLDVDDKLRSSFPSRWAAVTRARLLLKQGRAKDAIESITRAEADARAHADERLHAVLQLTLGTAYAISGDHRLAVLALVAATRATEFAELKATYYGVSEQLMLDLHVPTSGISTQRALALWNRQGLKTAPSEVLLHEPRVTTQVRPIESSEDIAATILDRVAATMELLEHEDLAANELAEIARACGLEGVQVTTSRNKEGVAIAIGSGKHLVEVLRPQYPRAAVVTGSLKRLARGLTSLNTLRREQGRQAALWPLEPVETEAGALFIAEGMQELIATVRRIAPTTVPVLITGETGTGKEVLARLIHAYSARAKATFLPFNCSATPKEMLDAQLFGYRRGAFTGAVDAFPGVIRSAAKGTLFLDEIGEATLDVQPKLLRFLESGEVHPLGETQPVKVDARIVAATNADLDRMVSDKTFREDLFYRLNIVPLHIPPLRERRVEIPPLANHYLLKSATEFGKHDLRFAEETMEYLVLYKWPGNVRQLANEMRRIAALAENGAVIMPEHLTPVIANSRLTIPAGERVLEDNELVVRIDRPLPAVVHHIGRKLILRAMKLTGGRVEETAALLGISRKGLYLKRRRFGIDEPDEVPALETA